MATNKNKYANQHQSSGKRKSTARSTDISSKNKDQNTNAGKKTQNSVGSNQWIWLLGALVLTLLAFYPSFSAGWVNWDDEVNVLDNNAVKFFDTYQIFTTHVIGNYNPLTILSFAIEWSLYQNNPLPYHMHNVILHLLCTALVFILSKRLGANNLIAFVITCLFGFQPMRVESVTWITERKDVLYGFFYLWALVIYAKNKTSKIGPTLMMMVLMVLSCLSKIQAVSLPLSMLAIDFLRNGKWNWKDVFSKIPFFMIALITGLVGIYFLAEKGSLSVMTDETNYGIIQRIFIGIYTYVIYIVKAIVPYQLSPLYPYPGEFPVYFYFAIIPLAALIWAIIKFKNVIPREFLFGLLFFTVNVIFMLQVLGAGQGFLADRFTYIAYFGLFFGLGYLIYFLLNKFQTNAGLIKGVTFASLLVFWIMTNNQTKIWKDSVTLWSHVLKYFQNTSLPYWNRANAYRDLNNYDDAIKDYNEAIRLEPNKLGLYNSRGKLYFNLKQFDKAAADYLQGLKIDSTNSELYVNLAASKASINDMNAALFYVNKAIKFDPKNPNAYKTHFIMMLGAKDDEAALKDAENAIKYGLREGDMYFERSFIFARRNMLKEAMDDLNTSIEIGGPNLAIYYGRRAEMKQQAGDTAGAANDKHMSDQLKNSAK